MLSASSDPFAVLFGEYSRHYVPSVHNFYSTTLPIFDCRIVDGVELELFPVGSCTFVFNKLQEILRTNIYVALMNPHEFMFWVVCISSSGDLGDAIESDPKIRHGFCDHIYYCYKTLGMVDSATNRVMYPIFKKISPEGWVCKVDARIVKILSDCMWKTNA
jgi:hypothetical protein